MLKIQIRKDFDKVITKIDKNFTYIKKTEWFKHDFVKRVIREIDHAEVVDGDILRNQQGNFLADKLSTGAKALIMMYETDYIFNATSCGDNCAPFILELAEMKDLTICLRYYMTFPRDFTALILDTDTIINDRWGWYHEFYKVAG